jgi:hypothetical protein
MWPDGSEIVRALNGPADLLGRFQQVHFLWRDVLHLNIFSKEYQQISLGERYETDFFGWLHAQARHLRNRDYERLDTANLAEELEGLARSDKRALRSHLRQLICHLLKMQFQAQKRSRSWILTATRARDDISELLNESPSLRTQLKEMTESVYPQALRLASAQTKLPPAHFPSSCPYSLEQLVDPEFFPSDET